MILSILTVSSETMVLNLSDNKVLRLHGPNWNLANSILKLRNLDDNTPHDIAAGVLNRIVKKILDNNDENLKFTIESICKLPEDTKIDLLNGYIAFAKDVCKGIVLLQSSKEGS